MRMRFEPGDEKGFERGSRLLLEQFQRWLVERAGATSEEAAEVVADASVALDWKWGYGDGNLGCWHREELAEFLLEWCPRKLSVPLEECGGLPAAVHPGPFIDVLAHRFATGGREALTATLAVAGNHDDQVAAIAGLWRAPSPATLPVLEAIGKLHTVKFVAKAARKAAFQRRSWEANR